MYNYTEVHLESTRKASMSAFCCSTSSYIHDSPPRPGSGSPNLEIYGSTSIITQAQQNMSSSVGMMKFPMYGKIKFMFQTTRVRFFSPLQSLQYDLRRPWGQALHTRQFDLSFPCSQLEHCGQLRFTLPWGQGLQIAHLLTVYFPCGHPLHAAQFLLKWPWEQPLQWIQWNRAFPWGQGWQLRHRSFRKLCWQRTRFRPYPSVFASGSAAGTAEPPNFIWRRSQCLRPPTVPSETSSWNFSSRHSKSCSAGLIRGSIKSRCSKHQSTTFRSRRWTSAFVPGTASTAEFSAALVNLGGDKAATARRKIQRSFFESPPSAARIASSKDAT